MIEQIFFAAVGVALLVLTFKLVHKEKFSFAFIVFITALASLLLSATFFQGLMKTGVISTVISTLKLYGNRLDDFQTTITSMGDELSKHQAQIDSQQKALADQEAKIQGAQTNVAAQQESITNQYQQISSVQSDLATAQTNLNLQAEKIQNVEFLVDNLFSKTFTESFSGSDSNTVSIVSISDGFQFVAIKTKYAPVNNSIHGIFSGAGVGQSPLMPFTGTYKNVVGTYWRGSDAKDVTFNLQYVIDSRQTNLVQKLEVRGKQIFADNMLTWEAPSTNDVSK